MQRSQSPQNPKVRRGQSPNQLSPNSIKRESDRDNGYQKKGWLLLWHANSKDWTKHWFVLRGTALLYYNNIEAEEQEILDGSISLSSCNNVKEYPIEKNSGFRIYTHEGAVQLAALTDNIRYGWLQAIRDLILKNEEHDSSRRHRTPVRPSAQHTGNLDGTRKKSPNINERDSPSPSRSPIARRGGMGEPLSGASQNQIHASKSSVRIASPEQTGPVSPNSDEKSEAKIQSGVRTRGRRDAGSGVMKTKETANAPLAHLDTTSTSFQISSGGEELNQSGVASQNSSVKVPSSNARSRLNLSQNAAAEPGPVEKRPMRMSPREEETMRLRMQVKSLTNINADLRCQIDFLKNTSLTATKTTPCETHATQTATSPNGLDSSETSYSNGIPGTDQELKELRSAKESLQKKVEVLSASRTEQLSEIAALQEKLEETQKCLRNVQSRSRTPMGRLRGDNFAPQSSDSNTESEQTSDKSQVKVRMSNHPADTSDAKLIKLNAQVESLSSEVRNFKTSNNKLTKQLETETEQNFELEKELKKVRSELESCQKTMISLKEELGKSQKNVKELQSEINSKTLAKRRVETKDSASENSSGSRNQCADKSHNQIAAKLVAAEQSLQILQKSFDEDSKTKAVQIDALKAELREANAANDELKRNQHRAINETGIKNEDLNVKLLEAEEKVELIERKAAIEKLRFKKTFRELTDNQAKLIRENAKFARSFEKLDRESREKDEKFSKLEAEKEKVIRQKKDLEHFMEKRLNDSKLSGKTSKGEKGIQVALPTSYEHSLEQQMFELKRNFEDERDFFKRLGSIFPNLGLFSSTELMRIFRDKLAELKKLRDRAKVLEKQILRWDNPRDTPQGCVNEFVVTAYQLAAVEYTCGLLKRQLDSDGSEDDKKVHAVRTKGGKFEVPLVRWSSSELTKQLLAIEENLVEDVEKLPLLTRNLVDKCSSALKVISERKNSCVNCSDNEKLLILCGDVLQNVIRDLRTERRVFCDVIHDCCLSAQFAESLTADVVHIVESSRKSLGELVSVVDKHIHSKQKQLPLDDLVTTVLSNLEVSLDAISNETPASSAFPRLRHTLQSISQTLNHLYSREQESLGNSEHSSSPQGVNANHNSTCNSTQPTLRAQKTGVLYQLCQKLVNLITPPENQEMIESKLSTLKSSPEENAMKSKESNTSFKLREDFFLNGGSDCLMTACHWLVCCTLVSSNQNESNSPVNWSQVHAVVADIETELDRQIDNHLELIESFCHLISENRNNNNEENKKASVMTFEVAERLNNIFESHRLKHSQCMGSIVDKLSSVPGHEDSLSQLSQILSGSSDLRNAGSYQKWLNVEIDNSVLRLENFKMLKLLGDTSNAYKLSHVDNGKLGLVMRKVDSWCESHPLEGISQVYLDPDVERSLMSSGSNTRNSHQAVSDSIHKLPTPSAADRIDDSASLINYIILKAFLCSSAANQNPAADDSENNSFQVTLLPAPFTSLDYSSFSSLILTAAIYLNQLQSLISRLGKHFPKELKVLRSQIKSSGQNMDNISQQHEKAEKFLNVLSSSEITSTLQRIADGYTKHFKKQRQKYVETVLCLQKIKGVDEEGRRICENCSGVIQNINSTSNYKQDGIVCNSDQEQLKEDLMRTLESVNSYSQYVSKLLHPDVDFSSQEKLLELTEVGGNDNNVKVIDPFSEHHNAYIAEKLNTLEKRWKNLAGNIETNINVKTTACCEEVFRGAFDIGLLILFAHRVGVPIHEQTFANKFSEELQAIKGLYDEAIDRTVTKCETIINRYNDLCEREIDRLRLVFGSVVETDQYIGELTDKRILSMQKIDSILSSISVVHFNPQTFHELKSAYELQMQIVDQEVRSLATKLKSTALEAATLEQNVDELFEEIEILRSHNAVLEDELNDSSKNQISN